jgi:hypothetical protein
MNKYIWTAQPVPGGRVHDFARDLEMALNRIEAEGFEIDDILDAPLGRQDGVVVVGRRSRPPS